MSNHSLDKLIASLKSEGIEAAEKKASAILDNARQEAGRIRREAEAEKQQILADAAKQAEDIVDKGKSALRQAERDLALEVRNRLLHTFAGVLEKEVQRELTPELVKKAIGQVIENVGSDAEFSLSKAFSADLAEYVRQRTQQSDQLAVREDENLLTGLRIRKSGQGWSYEITPEEIAGLLRTHLTGKWVEILKEEQ